jgi:hypothetical protein
LPTVRPRRDPEQRRSDEATFVPKDATRGAHKPNTRQGDDAREAALWREFHRASSVADLARALAARLGGGTGAEEFIAAANGAAMLGPPKPG